MAELFNKYTDIKDIPEDVGNYIAGFVDGEGHFGLHSGIYEKKPRKLKQRRPLRNSHGGGYVSRWMKEEQIAFHDICERLVEVRRFVPMDNI